MQHTVHSTQSAHSALDPVPPLALHSLHQSQLSPPLPPPLGCQGHEHCAGLAGSAPPLEGPGLDGAAASGPCRLHQVLASGQPERQGGHQRSQGPARPEESPLHPTHPRHRCVATLSSQHAPTLLLLLQSEENSAPCFGIMTKVAAFRSTRRKAHPVWYHGKSRCTPKHRNWCVDDSLPLLAQPVPHPAHLLWRSSYIATAVSAWCFPNCKLVSL